MCHVFKSFHNSRPPSRDFATKGRFPPILPRETWESGPQKFSSYRTSIASSAAGASLRPQSGLPPEKRRQLHVTLSFQRGNPCLKIENRCGSRTPLFASERDDDLLVAPHQDHLAILDRPDRDLIRLIAKSQTKLLALRHCLAVDDGKMSAGVEGDGCDRKGGGKDIRATMGAGVLCLGHGFPADRPEWITAVVLGSERRQSFRLNHGTVGGAGPNEVQPG